MINGFSRGFRGGWGNQLLLPPLISPLLMWKKTPVRLGVRWWWWWVLQSVKNPYVFIYGYYMYILYMHILYRLYIYIHTLYAFSFSLVLHMIKAS